MKRLRISIRGRVQGVWYRASAKAEATRLSLGGWVWNRPDGSVEILVQGPPDRLEVFLEWCRRGPDLARVDSVEVREEPVESPIAGFGFGPAP